ncbi:MAG: sigma 54-interacting transcriptional regulator [Betaproteobacteria bacterium]|nr:sigma 54-interacting transcriptional regulator [Betaproteobacteria bacterium]
MSGKRILLVDDDADLLRLLSIRLSSAGYEVTAVESAEKALAAMGAALPDLVITDMRMSGMDGAALFDAVHAAHPTLPVIILTAHGTIPDAVEATQRGVFGYLTKPYEPKVLLEQVEKALQWSGAGAAPAGEDAQWRADILTRSPAMEELLAQARLVAASDASVFIQGPSGSGKEMLAAAIHRASPRRDKPFVAINCGAIPEQLLESELFGHIKGAFTGATRDHRGLFQAAHGGTLFLDEIGDMPLPLQVKLLRVLEERRVRPVGSTTPVAVDVRIISATHRDLPAAKASGSFREDLYYRLNVVALNLPPLAERREDIPLLAGHFLRRLAEKYGRPVNAFSPEAMELLAGASWPGNVRQLYNVVEQTVALCTTAVIPLTLVQKAIQAEQTRFASFDEARKRFERQYLTQLLRLTAGNVSQAARLAKRNRTEFYKLLQRHQLDPALFKIPKP